MAADRRLPARLLRTCASSAIQPPARLPAPSPPPAPLPCRSWRQEFEAASGFNEALHANLSKAVDDLHPIRVQQLFSAISQAVSERWGWVLGADSTLGRVVGCRSGRSSGL